MARSFFGLPLWHYVRILAINNKGIKRDNSYFIIIDTSRKIKRSHCSCEMWMCWLYFDCGLCHRPLKMRISFNHVHDEKPFLALFENRLFIICPNEHTLLSCHSILNIAYTSIVASRNHCIVLCRRGRANQALYSMNEFMFHFYGLFVYGQSEQRCWLMKAYIHTPLHS